MNARDKFAGAGLSLLVAILFLSTSVRVAQAASETPDYNVRVEAVATDQSSVDVLDSKGALDHLVVKDTSLRDRVKQLQKGDLITLMFAPDADGHKELKLFSVDATPATPRARVGVLISSVAICFLLYFLLSGLHPLRVIIGEDGRYSNSKFQIALWFAVLITTYIATIWLRAWYAGTEFFAGVNIPQNLLLISGMSVLTFGAAKGITTSKVEDAKANGIADPKNSANATANFFLDLTHSDGSKSAAAPAAAATPPQGAAPPAPGGSNVATQRQLDLGDLQMVVVTLLAVAVYFVLVFNFLGIINKTVTVSLPDVDTTILAAFGLGHGAYLTKKAVGTVGQS